MSTVPYKKLYRQIILLLHGRPVGIMVSCLRFLMKSKNYTDKYSYYYTGGRLALWYHVYGSLWTAKIIQTNNLIITREAGWCYGIMSTVPHEQQKLYRQIILLLHGRPVTIIMSMLDGRKNWPSEGWGGQSTTSRPANVASVPRLADKKARAGRAPPVLSRQCSGQGGRRARGRRVVRWRVWCASGRHVWKECPAPICYTKKMNGLVGK